MSTTVYNRKQPRTFPAVSAQPSPAVDARFFAICECNGWYFSNTYNNQTVATDGNISKMGGSCDIGFSGAYHWGNSSGVYQSVIGVRRRLSVNTIVGTHVVGELIRQPATGAIGRIVRVVSGVARVAHVSGTWNGTDSVESLRISDQTFGSQLLVNPEFSGAVAGTPGTPPTSWSNSQTTGELQVSGSTLTFVTSTTRRSIFQSVSVTPGTYEFSITATSSDTPTHWDAMDINVPPAGTTLEWFIDGVLGTNGSTWTGTVELKVRATITTAGTLQVRLGAGVVGNRTQTISHTAPLFRTASVPMPLWTAAVTALESDDPYRFLVRSVDGFENYYPVLDHEAALNTSTLARIVIDCGEISISGTPKKTLIMAAYDDTPSSPVYYNHPEDNDVWTQLFNVDLVGGESPIRHWHGGTFIPGLGANEGTLVLFAGDSNEQSAIHVCDDIEDLIANPNTWFERWALHLAGTDRTAHLATDTTKQYTWTFGSQSSRTVELVVDANREFAYYLPDNSGTNGFGLVRTLHKIDLANKVVSTIDTGKQYTADGWYGCLCNGVVLLSDISRWSAGSPTGGSDEFLRIYAVVDDKLNEIRRIRRAGTDGFAQLTNIFAWDSHVFYIPIGTAEPIEVFRVAGPVSEPGASVLDRAATPVPYNCIQNPRFENGLTNHTSLTRCTAAIVTDVVDSEYNSVRSLRLTPNASGSAIAVYAMPTEILNYLRNKWVTFSCRILAPTSLAATQRPRIGYGQLFTGASTILSPVIPESDEWQTVWLSIFVPDNATVLPVWLYAADSGTDTDPVYFSDLCLVEGRDLRPRNQPFLNVFGLT